MGFKTGSQHVARVQLTNTKDTDANCSAVLGLLGTDVTSSTDATVSAGGSANADFLVTMPSVPGIYTVQVSVYQQDVLVAQVEGSVIVEEVAEISAIQVSQEHIYAGYPVDAMLVLQNDSNTARYIDLGSSPPVSLPSGVEALYYWPYYG